ncbi:RNA polymerase sigma factor [Gluconacetobacter sp.]|uniref:RNA polymerase sigma factor n=1 Tax=Gluconacetobacter sp. TaxID=1935994 RepID=UPI0039EC3C7B
MTGSGSRTWPEIFSEQRPGLLRFLLQKLGNRELAEDLTQDVWVRIARGGCTVMPDNPAKYLYRIATNLAIDHLRRARHGIEVQADDARTEHVIAETVSPEDATIQRDQIERLRAVLDTLPPRSREIFMLARFEGLSYHKIGEMLGMSRHMVMSHMMTALTAVEDALDPPSGAPEK